MIKKNIRYLMLMAAMLLAGGSAWGTDYFRYAEENDDPSGWTNSVAATCSSGTCTATIPVTPSRTIYIGYAEGGSSYSDMYKGTISLSQSGLYWIQDQEKNGYHFPKFSTSTTTVNVSYNTSTHAYTITAGAAATYDVATSVTGGTIDPESYDDVTSGTSVSFTVDPEDGYTYKSATYSGGTSGDITRDGDTFTFTPTGSGTFNVVYSLKYNVTPSVSGGTVSPSTAQSVTSGSSVSFTVTPATEDHDFGSVSYSGTYSALTQDGNTFTITPTSSGILSIVYVGHSAPQVCIGKEPSFSDCALTVGAYVAQRGCDNVDKFTLFYSNNSMFRSDGNYKIDSLNVNSLNISSNNYNYDIDLSDTDIEKVANPGETLYLRLKGHNTNGWSAFSEVVPVKYECNRFVTEDIDVDDFKACPGQHQFKWRDMFLSPVPTTWSATLGGDDATSDFQLVDGQMIWMVADSKASGTYVYTFAAHNAESDIDGEATLTIKYEAPGSLAAGKITGLTPSTTSAKPYEAVELEAEGTTGDIVQIEWTSVPASATFSDISTDLSGDDIDATATFRANKITSTMTYTVTVAGYDADCASSKASTTITVTPDTAEECD